MHENHENELESYYNNLLLHISNFYLYDAQYNLMVPFYDRDILSWLLPFFFTLLNTSSMIFSTSSCYHGTVVEFSCLILLIVTSERIFFGNSSHHHSYECRIYE